MRCSKLLTLSLILVCLSALPAVAGELRLEDLEAKVLSSHPMVKALDMSVQRAMGALDQAKAGLMPKVDAVLYGSKAKEPPQGRVYDLQDKVIGKSINGYEETYKASLALSQVLYSGGTLTSQVRAAEAALDAARAERTRGVEGLMYQLRMAYIGVLRARAKVQVARSVVELAEAHLKRVESFYRVGMVPRADVLRAQVSLSDARVNLIRAEGAFRRAYAALDRAAGFGVPRDIVLLDPTTEALELETALSDLGDIGVSYRGEIKSLEMSYRQAKALADAASGQDRPQVIFKGEAYKVGGNFFPSDKDDYLLSLTMQWRLWDGGENRAKASQSLRLAEGFIARVEDMKLEVRRQVVDAVESLREAGERVRASETMLEQAREDHRIALRRYDARVGTNLDVMDARVRLEQAMNGLVDARYDLLSSQAALRYALGEEGWRRATAAR